MSTNPFVRAGRRLRRGLLAAVPAACALPAAASATTVSIDNNGTLRYFNGRGATNNLFAREDGSAIFITDAARVDPVSFAPGSIAHLCTRVNTSTVRCPFDAGPVRIKRFSAKMGDGNDSARVNVLSVPVEIEGQGGSDQYIGGGSSTLSRLRFRGGDDENIDRDVERLSGSPFADDLTAGSDATTQLRGGLGKDVRRAGAAVTVFDIGPAADGPGFVRIRDEVLLREVISECSALSTFEVRCAVARGRAIILRQGDRDDRAEIVSTAIVGVDAAAGNDTYVGGLTAGSSNVLFRGGTGTDTVSYADATARVDVRLADGGDDGRPGDTDEIADAETIVGSRFGDDLVGTPAAETFRPGQGDDVVHGEGGADRYESLTTTDGADRILGTGGADIVSYAGRTRRVTATVDAGGADDGEAGERDELVGVAGVRGGSGADTLSLERTVDAELDGGAGDDTLTSGGGDDVLVGGAGVDTLSSGAGVDRVVASDPDRDTVDCGSNSPDEAIVSPGGETTTAGCERVLPVRTAVNTTRPGGSVGTLRLAPSALDVPAGGVARVRLSWTHPRRWRELRRIELRLVRAGEVVARIAVDPRRRKVHDDRAAARIAREGTRLVRGGRRVSARLALRLDGELAGARLRVEVAAADVRGRRRVERAAGAIRVLP